MCKMRERRRVSSADAKQKPLTRSEKEEIGKTQAAQRKANAK